MRTSVAFFLIAQVLCGCQAANGLTAIGDETDAGKALQRSETAQAIASDLSGELKAFIPEGSAIALRTDDKQVLSVALEESLVRQGYRKESDGEAILLQVWSTEIEGDLLVRLSTPTHRLSKVYRQAPSVPGLRPDSAASGGVDPAGPLLVERISRGAPS